MNKNDAAWGEQKQPNLRKANVPPSPLGQKTTKSAQSEGFPMLPSDTEAIWRLAQTL